MKGQIMAKNSTEIEVNMIIGTDGKKVVPIRDGKDGQAVFTYCYDDLYDIECVRNRRLLINSEIDETIISSCVYHIMRWNREDVGIKREDRKPIIIYINTPGGSVVDGYGLIDAMLASTTPVYTVNLAACYSMGFLIFIAGEKRYAMEHSTFLCHDGSTGGYDSTTKMRDRINFESGAMENATKSYILDRTTISDKLYERKRREEWYFYADEGKKNGVVTHIIGHDCGYDDIL